MSNISLHFPLSRDNTGNKIASLSQPILFLFLLVLFFTLRLWNISTFSLWGGEGFKMIGVEKSWGEMIAYAVDDGVHPPLIYILLKLWIVVGSQSVLWLKLFPVITSLASIAPFLLLCRELKFRLPETNLALLLLSVNGYLIHYSQELRMYSLFMFLSLCSFWLFIRFFNSPPPQHRQLILLTVINLLAIFTHYYGWVVVGLEFLFLLIWQRHRLLAYSLSVLFLALCFAPWAYLVAREALSSGGMDEMGWAPKPEITDVLKLYVTFNGPIGNSYTKLVGFLGFGLPVAIWAWQIIRSGQKQQREEMIRFSWLAVLPSVPVLALFAISQNMERAMWVDRYFIFIAIPYMMLVAAAVFQIKPVWVRNVWVLLIVLTSLSAGLNDLQTNRMAWEYPQLGSRLNWDQVVQQMVAAEGQPTGPIPVYTLPTFSQGVRTGDWAISTSIDYQLHLLGETRFHTIYAVDNWALAAQVKESHFWVAYFDVKEFPASSPLEVLASKGYRAGAAIVYANKNDRLVLVQLLQD
jgi:hypothetical protein